MPLRFDGKVVVVTGAGAGLGRTYAIEYAKLGAKVVVNDLGVSSRGEGNDTKAADKVVAEIKAAGGVAVANYDNVVNGENIIKTAIDNFGRIDILINNAGIIRDITFAKMSDQDWKLLHDVHLNGVYQCTKAAWPYMMKQKFGRIIMVTSAAGLYGNYGQSHYSAVKMGVVGFANTLWQEGKKNNIHVNTIAPIAGSRLTEQVLPPDLVSALKPEYVSPLVLYLTHENTSETGGIFEVGAGWVSKLRWERTQGFSFPLNQLSIEAVRDQWGKVIDFTNSTLPTSSKDAFESIMANLSTSNAPQPSSTSFPANPASSGSKGGAKKSNPNVDVAKAKNHVFEKLPFTYAEKDAILYALSIGAAADPLDKKELKFAYENADDFCVFPTFGVVIPKDVLSSFIGAPGLTFDPMMLLHGEQYMELKSPLPTSGTLYSQAKVTRIVDKKSGALVTLQCTTTDAKGAEILFNEFSLFIRGLGGFEGGDESPSLPSYDPPAQVPPQVVHREKTLENQALIYRLTGDTNPLHVDPAMAAIGKFPRPILHGLCSFGIAARAVLRHFADNDVKRFKSIRARFVKHVFPGETLIVEMWRTSSTEIIFRVKVAERGEYVLANACVTLHPLASDANSSSSSASSSSASPAVAQPSGFEAEKVFNELSKNADESIVKKVNATYRFDITKGGASRSWLLNLKTGKGSVSSVDPSTKADCIVGISDEDFVLLMNGKLNAQKAFMGGKLTLKGNMMLAQKLQHLQAKPKL